MKPTFFATSAAFRAWLEGHHNEAAELWVGFHKIGSGKPSITWPESVDQALCFGWIDGVRQGIDDGTYAIRFSPRKPGSIWSAANQKRIQELSKEGLVQAAGLAAFKARRPGKSGVYSYEQRTAAKLQPNEERRLRANRPGWKFFHAQAPSYRKAAIWWIVSAKKEETREKRLEELIRYSSQNRPVPPLRPRVRAK